MNPLMRSTVAVGLLLIAACASTEAPVFRTTPGIETVSLLGDIDGHFALAHQGDLLPCEPIVSIAVPSSRRCLLHRDLTRPDPDSGLVPESDRSLLVLRLWYDEKNFRDRRFMLIRRRCNVDGPLCRAVEETLATWQTGSGALYRKSLALSPDGRWLALLPASSPIRLDGFKPAAPDGYHFADRFHTGEIVLVDLKSGAVRNTGVTALDEQPISWSRDARRLLLVRAETIHDLDARMRDELRGREGAAERPVPVIESWDVDTGAIEMLAIGLEPLWSPDGKALLFTPVRAVDVSFYAGDDRTPGTRHNDAYELRDLVSGARRDVVMPGLVGPRGAIAFVGPTKVLYWALPTAGTPPSSTDHNSPLIGPKQMMALKIGDFESQQFATVYRRVDPRAQVGYTNR